jgi:ADP-ribose/FAD diphosphatase
VREVPEGDDRERAICSRCRWIHFENPKMVVGCLVEHERQLLLCRRSIEPGRGRWTVPAGFLELDEGLAEGALRETREEALARAEIIAPHATLDLPHIGQIYTLFRARLVDARFGAGHETLEAALFDLDALPWDELAFPVVHFALELLLEDRRRGCPRVHVAKLDWIGSGSRFDPGNYRLGDHLDVPLA